MAAHDDRQPVPLCPRRLRGGLRLAICLAAMAWLWLWALPSMSRWESQRAAARRLELLGVNPGAIFYTELDTLPDRAGAPRS